MRQAILPGAVVGLIAFLVLPLPLWLIDLGIALNLGVSILLLVRALQLPKPEQFTTLPALLLLTTLLRLGLNVATTRQLLAFGNAPQIVVAFAEFAAGGSIVAGVTVFIVLIVVQFVVIAKGAERVGEVCARFTLDALPGKQLAIDAEVRAGSLTAGEARLKRQELQRESRFHGALDGAMKFIKGDAIAGLVITLVNICVGFGLGVMDRGLGVSEALEQYSLLTVGDGLVSQIPALMVALSAGVVISRVTDEEQRSLGSEIFWQIGGNRGSLIGCGAMLALLAIVPGFPAGAFLAISGATIVAGYLMGSADGESSAQSTLSLLLTPALLPRGRLVAQRTVDQIAHLYGVPLPLLQFGPSPTEKNLLSVGASQVVLDSRDSDSLQAEVVNELAQSLPLLLDDLLTERILAANDASCGSLIQKVVPQIISVTQLTRVLRALLDEGVPIVQLRSILQAVAESSLLRDAALVRREDAFIIEARIALGESIVQCCVEDGAVEGWVLDTELDRLLVNSFFSDVPLASTLVTAIADCAMKTRVIVATRYARRVLSQLLRRRGMNVTVLAPEEFPPHVIFRCVGKIQVEGLNGGAKNEARLS